MKNLKSALWGIIFITVGVLLALKSFDLINFNIFFDGWWTLFIIIPCFIGIITDHDKIGNIIGLLIGVLLLLICNNVISFGLIWKLLIPTILILIGISCIFKNSFKTKIEEKVKKTVKNNEICATFSSQKINYNEEKFEGCEIDAIFGGVELDLRNAIITKDVAIDANAIFGGIDIFVPDNCNVKVSSTSIFGGVDDKTKKNKDIEGYTIFIEATAIFGGVEIK